MKESNTLILELIQWFQTPEGEQFINWEQSQFDSIVTNAFGYQAWQISFGNKNFLRKNRIPFKAFIDTSFPLYKIAKNWQGCVITELEYMPFESQSIDLFLLPHVFERSKNPYFVLRELSRVIIPEGRILISGFNPWSLWHINNFLLNKKRSFPLQSSSLVSFYKLKNWLELLSFDLDIVCFGGCIPICTIKKYLNRYYFTKNFGNCCFCLISPIYIISAIKRCMSLPLMKPYWEIQKQNQKISTVILDN
ncbi:MAG: methyltransferase domain-containing protein [Bordetella sp.]|nr:MAG: methyltransferase domain-containing protein [Bordetella sp.]